MNGRTAFVHRYLDPSESLLEILFGLIMAFTITAGARLLSAPHELVVGEQLAPRAPEAHGRSSGSSTNTV